MKAKEIFGIIVRTFGLSLLIYAIWYLSYGIASLIGFQNDSSELRAYFLTGGLQLLMGLYLLRGASSLVSFAYAEKQEPEKQPEKTNTPDDW